MKKPAVLVLEPESSGIDLIQAASELNLLVRIFDRRPFDTIPGELRDAILSHGAGYTRLETRSIRTILSATVELAGGTDLVAVVPGFEYAVPAAAMAARQVGLPGLDPAVAEAMRNKDQMKKILSAAGVQVAPGVALDVSQISTETLSQIALEIGFPAVVKPVDGSGSLGVTRVDDLDALRGYLARTGAGHLVDMGRSVGTRLMVEKYVSGPEFSVEGYATPDGVTIVSATEKKLGPEPHFVELGHIVDADIDACSRKSLERTADLAVRALGLTRGVFHLEARLTSAGPVVMEAAARLAGDRIPRLISLVHGCDLPRVMIRCLAGLPVPAPPKDAAHQVAAVRLFTTDRVGRIVDPAGLAGKLADLPGCAELRLDVTAESVLRPATDFRQRFGHLVVTAPERRRLDAVLGEADELLRTAIEEVH